MRRKDFQQTRKRQGRMAEVGDAHQCKTCRAMVVPVMTRRLPPMFLLFNNDDRGRLHVHENRATYADRP